MMNRFLYLTVVSIAVPNANGEDRFGGGLGLGNIGNLPCNIKCKVSKFVRILLLSFNFPPGREI